MDHETLDSMVSTTLNELIESGLVTDNLGIYEATRLSQATVSSYLTPEDGIFLHGELQRALRAFVMDGEMHIFYTFTPVYSIGTADINWPVFRKEMESLDESGLRVLELVGVNPGMVNRMQVTHPLRNTTNSAQGQQRKIPPRDHPLRNQNRTNLPPLLHRPPTPRPLQRTPHPRRRPQILRPPGLRPDPSPNLRRLRRRHDPILRQNGLGHAQSVLGAHERSTQGGSASGPARAGADPVCEK